ncbi:hypothetical protein [uncultured Methylobacterium sp.]|jgi:hypothetical protein|uniref:hypothetical protein n=1 Tax=uncultured Methylobacterium sp. TaxID=157278 RepID=UPI002627737D|nr:hypothetical protein [uncultured Methylobacterium sp.]
MAGVRTSAASALIAGGLLAGPAAAEVTRFEIVASERPALQGRTFGERGTAEKITGRATVALDPADPHNAVIADIGLSPRNAEGQVEAVADVVLLRPQHPNGLLPVEIPNRGRKLIGPLVQGTATEASTGRSGSASRNRAGCCATCCISASTRTSGVGWSSTG